MRGLRCLIVVLAALGVSFAAQADVASAVAPLNLRDAPLTRPGAGPGITSPTDVGTWEAESNCSGELCTASVTISIGGQEARDPACTAHSYCVSTLSGGLYFYGEAVSISPGVSGTWTYNCVGCTGKELIQVKFEGNTFTGTAESINSEGKGSGSPAAYNGHLLSTGTEPSFVSGTITTPAGDGEGGVKVGLFGDRLGTTTTAADGSYSFEVEPGSYDIQPDVAGPAVLDEFKVKSCEGTIEGTICEGMKVEPGERRVADYSAGFTLSGTVVGASGGAVSGATVHFLDEEQGRTKTATATTASTGIFEARLAPGTVTATVEKLSGTEYFPVPSAECKPSKGGCAVELNQDRKVEFSSCVVPNPNGEALPASTPSSIPGAQTVGNLEAVGCWSPQSDGTYTSTKPVRLNGIDVNPEGSTKIILNPDATVTSDGPAEVGPGGVFKIPLEKVDLGFQAAQMQASDLGTSAATFGIPMSIKGVPFSLTTGGSSQTLDPPWVSVGGKTSISVNLQFPTTLNATTWNVEKGAFFNGGEQISSLGAAVTLSVTNRDGLIAPEVCAKFTGGELKLWNLNSNLSGITQATACYDFHAEQWALTGLFQLPESGKLGNKVYVKLGWIKGWNWNEGQVEFDGVQKMLAQGVFVQRFGAKFHRDFTGVPPTGSNFGVTMGLSFGPQLNRENAKRLVKQFPGLDGAELLTLDGEGSLQPWSTPPVYKLSGDILMLRNTPLQAVLAGGNVAFYSSGRFDMSGELRVVMPITHWTLDGLISGFLDTERNVVQLSGTTSITGPWSSGAKAQVLLNNGALVVCLSSSGGYSAGMVYNYFTDTSSLFKPGICEIGAYTISAPDYPGTPAAGATAARAAAGRHALRLPGHLSGSTIAVKGSGAPPLVKLHGPGLTVVTPAGERGLVTPHVFLAKDPSSDTTYITLYRPHGGSWTVTALPGSARVLSVRAALPAPRAKLKARISGPECRRTLTYSAVIPHGESVALYAQNGSTRRFLGDARRRGRLAFTPDVEVSGGGEVVAEETRGEVPRSVRTVARFKTVALTRPERISGLRLRGRTLSWTAACDAVKYAITVHAGKRSLNLTSTSPAVKLPALRGSLTVTITAAAASGVQGPAFTRRLRAR